MKTSIYALYDSRFPQTIRYVGQTKFLNRRIKEHVRGNDGATCEWAQGVIKSGGTVGWKVLEETEPYNGAAAEQKWLVTYRHTVVNARKAPSKRRMYRIGAGKPTNQCSKGIIDFAYQIATEGPVSLAEAQRVYIQWAIEAFGGRRQEAAAALGIHLQTIKSHLEGAS